MTSSKRDVLAGTALVTTASGLIASLLLGWELPLPWASDLVLSLGGFLAALGVQRLNRAWASLRRRRDLRRITQDLERGRERQLTRLGDVQIDQLSIVASPPVGSDDVLDAVELVLPRQLGPPRATPPELAPLRQHVLPQLVEDAQRRGVGFYDELAVDLTDFRPTGEPGSSLRIAIELAPVSYFDFALTSNRLDAPLDELFPETTLRERWASAAPHGIDHASRLPAPVKVGVSTVIRSSDGHLGLLERGAVFQAPAEDGRRSLHCVAEGMTPDDRGDDGRFSPFRTARRGLVEELGVSLDDAVQRLTLTSICFDHQRWHAVFTAVADIQLTVPEIDAALAFAPHSHESRGLATFDGDPGTPDLRRLLTGTHPTFDLVSNHAAAAVLMALVSAHGHRTCARELRVVR